jgi:tyrosyl-tRNA synthetase
MIYKDIVQRNLVYQTSSNDIEKLIESGNATIYCGADATGPSIHIGHLIPFLTAKRILKNKSNRLIILIGGLTATIGDPKANSEREMIDVDIVVENCSKLKIQLEKLFIDVKDQVIFVNNADWGNKISLPEYLRDYGKLFNINNMLAKEVVASRLETGISYAEFSYQILQAIDYQKLSDDYNCNIQLGGSDQWGNITAGIDLVRKSRNKKVHAMTVPLLLKSDGQKIGKTENGAIFLDSNLTSQYDFFQYFINIADNDLENLLQKLTFIELSKIEQILKQHNLDPSLRFGQLELTRLMMEMIYESDAFTKTLKVSKVLFGEKINLTQEDFKYAQLQKITTVTINAQEDIITQIAKSSDKSKSEINRLFKQGAIKIDDEKITSEIMLSNFSDFGVISLGKKQKIIYARG